MKLRPHSLRQRHLMKTPFERITALVLGGLFALHTAALAQGFTESDAVFYGEVRKASGGQTFLLQAGELKITFVNQSNAQNRVTLSTRLQPTGNGDFKPYSYALNVPLAYLPEAARMQEFLSINTLATKFRVEQITIDGAPATLPDGSSDFYVLNFASKAGQYRLDLLVSGEVTSTANDGIPDWWKRTYGLNVNANVANDDADGDGWTNLEEFLRGSNPNDSNRDPSLATLEVSVPEMGEAGFYVQVLDSDTPDSGIQMELSGLGQSGFQLKWDGVLVADDSPQIVTLAALKSGRATISHALRTDRSFNIPLRWGDGGEMYSGEVIVRVVSPSAEDGSESSLWLDGHDLPAEGSPVSTWVDRSGSGRPATQPLPDYQPLVKGKAVDFSAKASAHLFMRDASLPTGDHTVLVSYQAAEASDLPQTLFSTNRGYLQVAATTQPLSYTGAPVYQMDNMAVRGFERSRGTTTSIFRRQAHVLQNIFGLAYDGEGSTQTAIAPVLPTLGARRSALPGTGSPVNESLFGRMQEMLVYPTALPEQKLRGVNDYLQSKWRGAVIWNFSTELKQVVLNTGSTNERRIIRGGFGNDQLSGGPADDILSGGGGDDLLRGGSGADTFVFGAVDVGRETISDFNPAEDVIDVSALFWGAQGDARNHVSVRLETSTSTAVPTLDSVLVVKRPDDTLLEIVLQNKVVTAAELLRWLAEGQIRMGRLSIPASVQLTLVRGSSTQPILKSLNQSFQVNITRTGAGVPAELDVPVGFFAGDAPGRFVVEGAASSEGQRSVVSFARGETSKTITVRPVSDLNGGGLSTLQVAALPSFKYSVEGPAVSQAVSDNPSVWLEVTQPNAVALPLQAAQLTVHRTGSFSKSLVVQLEPVGGTVVNGTTIQTPPTSVTLPAGQESVELLITARAFGLAEGPKVAVIKLASSDDYLLGTPHEGLVYVGNTMEEAGAAGFDRWLAASTQGAVQSQESLVRLDREVTRDHILAYAMGLESAMEFRKHAMHFGVVNSRPEFSNLGTFKAADVRWRVQSSTDLKRWTDVGQAFNRMQDNRGVRLVGPPRAPNQRKTYYRVSMSLDPGQSIGAGVAAFKGSSRYGLTGKATWSIDSESGDLVSAGGTVGKTSRFFVEVNGPTQIHFAMAIPGAGSGDLLTFYVDGVLHSQTSGPITPISQAFPNPGSHLLMWEFKKGSGNAMIRNLAP
jgi:hypothetical protein